MRRHELPEDDGFSLIQHHGDRALQLEKMRAKLASQSLGLRLPAKPRQRFIPDVLTQPISLGEAQSWAGRLLIALSLVAGNGAYLYLRHETKVRQAARHVPKLPVPSAKLPPERQALYWAYALYDFDRLTAEFGVPKGTVVDFAAARAGLTALLPRVDAPTRLAIERYLPRPKEAAR
jgi:hypothetical protein